MRDRGAIPPEGPTLRAMLAPPAPRGDPSESAVLRLRLLLLLLGHLDEPCQAVRRKTPGRGGTSTIGASSSKSPPTTATCCVTSSSSASRCLASTRPRMSSRRRSQPACRPRSVSSAGPCRATRRAGVAADLVVANNVFAHAPDTNDFAAGFARVLAPEGVLSIEFPELATMLLGSAIRPDLPRARVLLLALVLRVHS